MTRSPASGRWIRELRVSPLARTALVCLPHAGGCASFFRDWRVYLPLQYDLLAAQYPGREERYAEPCVDSMAELADGVAEALLSYAHLRLVLFGHSLGASLAYEVGCRLEARGVLPARLFASAHPAPHRPRSSNLHHQGDAALLDDVRRLARPGASLLDEPDLRDLFMPMLRGDYRIIETYRCETATPLQTPIDVLLPTQDSEISEDEAMAWQDLTQARLGILRVEGGHFYLQDQYPSLIPRLLRRLDGHLREPEGTRHENS